MLLESLRRHEAFAALTTTDPDCARAYWKIAANREDASEKHWRWRIGSGRRAEARRYYEKLVTLGSDADSDRPELADARAFLARGR